MSSDKIQRLHNVLLSGSYGKISRQGHADPRVQALYDKPHLAIFINGDWLPILPGMIIGLVKDRTKVDGIAPYRLLKVNAKPGYERIDLVAFSSNTQNTRTLRLGAKYAGKYISNVRDPDEVVDASIKAKQMAAGEDDD